MFTDWADVHNPPFMNRVSTSYEHPIFMGGYRIPMNIPTASKEEEKYLYKIDL